MHDLYAPAMVINKSGNYKLGDNITFNPAGADSIISITTSDVNLDLGGYFIAQGNTTANVNGINISSGLSNITIQNGKIRNVTNDGLIIQTTCNTVQILNIAFETCKTEGLSATSLSQGTIANCLFTGCCGGASADVILNLSNCNDTSINNCSLTENINNSNNITAINASGCNKLYINNTIVSDNSASIFSGIVLVITNEGKVENTILQKNVSSTADTTSITNIISLNNSFSSTLKNCMVNACTSNSGNLNAFSITGSNSIIIKCVAQSNLAFNVFHGYSVTAGNRHNLIDCIANNNTGVSGNNAGFLLSNTSNNALIRCIGTLNNIGVAGAGTITGLLLQTSAALNLIYDCQFSNNSANTAASSHGIDASDATLSNNTFSKNVATFNGGATASLAQQLLGIPATNQQAILSTGSLNAMSIPWTNIAIAPNP